MKRIEKHAKQHVVSLRISEEELDAIHEKVRTLQFQCVSELMREAFKLVIASYALRLSGIKHNRKDGSGTSLPAAAPFSFAGH